MDEYDLVVAGGGLVGGSLACALAHMSLRMCVVEAVPASSAAQPSYDERVIALAWGSRLILDGIGLWSGIAPEAEPILQVQVSDRGHFGFARLDHREEGVEALGYVAPARLIGHAIQGGLAGVEVLCPARLIGFRVQAGWVDLEVALGGESRLIRTRLLVAADGGDSIIRRRLGLPAQELAYGQDAVIATVTADRPQPGVAFERFTDSGPLAMLPMSAGRYSLVWTVREGDSAGLLSLSDAALLARLQARFGFRLGRFSRPGRRVAYPLKLLLARETVHPRLVLIGNAAHTLHPVAGQGFNLGLRDVAALAEVLAEAGGSGQDAGGDATLAAYRRLRGRDQVTAATVTDALVRLFVNPLAPLRIARDMGMLGLDLTPALRHLLARGFMGLGGRLPRLARGLPLVDRPPVRRYARGSPPGDGRWATSAPGQEEGTNA